MVYDYDMEDEMKLIRHIKQKLGIGQKTPVINKTDGAYVLLLPNLLHHAKLRAEGKVTVDFETWAKETYGNVKFI